MMSDEIIIWLVNTAYTGDNTSRDNVMSLCLWEKHDFFFKTLISYHKFAFLIFDAIKKEYKY
jgi:hypothetical protein